MMKKKWQDALFILVIAAMLTGIPLGTVLWARKEMTSYYENRMLSAFPALTADSLWSGKLGTELENWYFDHTPGRTTILKIDTRLQMDVLQRPVVNDIVLTEDLLLPKLSFAAKNKESYAEAAQPIAEQLGKLNDYVEENGGKMLFVGLPEQRVYFQDRFPVYLNNHAQEMRDADAAFMDAMAAAGVQMLNIAEVYDRQGHPDCYYSMVDHHFSGYGAYAAYRAILEELDADLPVLTENDVDFEELPNPYIGSRNRKLYNLWEKRDPAILPRQKNPVAYQRWDNGERTDRDLFVVPDQPNLLTTYNLYMGGDFGETIMRTDRPELPRALIVGESFSNGLETMLYTAFDETRSLDLRYYTERSLKDYITAYQPDYLICIQNDTSYYMTAGNAASWEDS